MVHVLYLDTRISGLASVLVMSMGGSSADSVIQGASQVRVW